MAATEGDGDKEKVRSMLGDRAAEMLDDEDEEH